MRIFVAIEFSDKVKKVLEKDAMKSRFAFEKGDFIHTENYHVTLKFIGEIPIYNVDPIKEIINKIRFKKFNISIGDYNAFLSNDSCTVYRKVEAPEKLYEIQKRIEDEFINKGYEIERQEFIPHVTIARDALLTEDGILSTIQQDKVEVEVEKISLMVTDYPCGRPTYKRMNLKARTTFNGL